MTVSELEQKVDFLALISEDYEPTAFGSLMTIDPCPVCGNFGHFLINPETRTYGSLDGCCGGGSVYAYLQEVRGCSPAEAYDKLVQLAEAAQPAKKERKLLLELDGELLDALESYACEKGFDINAFVEGLIRKELRNKAE
jgi:hypothetical protein